MMFWMKCLSFILGIKVDVRGTPDLSADLYVSNHVTYLDIIIINKLLPVNFIAKRSNFVMAHYWDSGFKNGNTIY